MLLIVTSTTDIGSDYLVHRLQQRDQDFVRLNTDEYPERYDVRLEVGEDDERYRIRFQSGRVIGPTDVTGVIFRRPVVPPQSVEIADSDAAFVEREQLELLRSLWRSIPEDLWLNHPNNLWLARNKYEQLLRARQYDFSIPDTVITASVDDVREFGDRSGWPIICKAVKHGFVIHEFAARLGTTRAVKEEDLEELGVLLPEKMAAN